MSGAIEIQAALRARLRVEAEVPTDLTKLSNAKFTPPAEGFWYKASFLPGEPYAAGIGSAARNRYVGIFQIDVYGQTLKGTKLTNDEGERIRQCFKRGDSFTYSGVVVRVTKSQAYEAAEQDEPAYFRHIVKVTWMSDVEN